MINLGIVRARSVWCGYVYVYVCSPRIKGTSTWVATHGNPECKQERRVLRPGLQGYEGFCLSTPRWLLLVPSPFPLWRTHSLFVLASWEVLYEFYEIVSLAFHFIQWISEVKFFFASLSLRGSAHGVIVNGRRLSVNHPFIKTHRFNCSASGPSASHSVVHRARVSRCHSRQVANKTYY